MESVVLRIVVAKSVIAIAFLSSVTISFGQGGPALVKVTELIEKKVSAGQAFVGTVEPRRSSVVGSAVDGRVEKLFFDEGDLVSIAPNSTSDASLGQPLVQLRTRTIGIEMSAVRAELDSLRAALAELTISLPAELEQAEAKSLGAGALAKLAKARHDRTEALFQDGRTTTEEELDEAKAAWVSAQQLEAVTKSLAKQLRETSTVRLAQARAKCATQEAILNRLEDVAQKYTIRSPFVGFVTQKFTEVGAWISKGDPVAEVIQLDPAEVRAFVPGKHVAQIQSGHKVIVRVDALPNEMFEGVVVQVVPRADVRSRAFPVKVRIANPNYRLKAGMLAHVVLPVGNPKKTKLVPKDALVLSTRGQSVFVGRFDEAAKILVAIAVPVTTGAAHDSLIEVAGDFKKGDRIVVRGNERLRPNQTLQIIDD